MPPRTPVPPRSTPGRSTPPHRRRRSRRSRATRATTALRASLHGQRAGEPVSSASRRGRLRAVRLRRRATRGLADGSHTFAVRASDPAGNHRGRDELHLDDRHRRSDSRRSRAKPTDPSNDCSPSFPSRRARSAAASSASSTAARSRRARRRRTTPASPTARTPSRQCHRSGRQPERGGDLHLAIDTVSPTATITGKPSNPSNRTSPSFSFTANESWRRFHCKLDEALRGRASRRSCYLAFAAGRAHIRRQGDGQGGQHGHRGGVHLDVDTIAPTVSITQKPSDPSNDELPELHASPQARAEAPSSAGWTARRSLPAPRPRGTPNLAEVTHTFVVKATDSAGNTGPEKRHDVDDRYDPADRLDHLRPDRPEQRQVTDLRVRLRRGRAASPASSMRDRSRRARRRRTTASTLADGSHTFVVRPTDLAGNVGASVSLAWTIDTTAPIAAVTQRPANSTNDSSPTFAFTSVDATAVSSAGSTRAASRRAARRRATRPSPTASTPSRSRQPTPPATPGSRRSSTGRSTPSLRRRRSQPSRMPDQQQHADLPFTSNEPGSTLRSAVSRTAGLPPAPRPTSYPSLPDGVAQVHGPGHRRGRKHEPRTCVYAGRSTPSRRRRPSASQATRAATSRRPTSPSRRRGRQYLLSAGSTAGAFAPCTSPKPHSSLAHGAHTFAVKATDKAGNTGSEAAYTWTIDTAAPTAAITQKPAALSNDNSPTFSFTASQAGSYVRLQAGRGRLRYVRLPEGIHRCPRRPPHVRRQGDRPGRQHERGDELHVDGRHRRAGDAAHRQAERPEQRHHADLLVRGRRGGSTFACKLDAGAFSPVRFADDPRHPLAPGPHTFSVRATDPAGNPGPPASHTWTIDTDGADDHDHAESGDPATPRAPSFSFTASETGSLFSCRLDGAAVRAMCDTAQTTPGSATARIPSRFGQPTERATSAPPPPTRGRSTPPPRRTSINAKPNDPSNETVGELLVLRQRDRKHLRLPARRGGIRAPASRRKTSATSVRRQPYLRRQGDRRARQHRAGGELQLADRHDRTDGLDRGEAQESEQREVRRASSSRPARPAVAFACRLEQGGFAPCVSPKSYGVLIDGRHDLRRAGDRCRRQPGRCSHLHLDDRHVGPTTAITAKPANPSNSTSPSFSFTSNEDATFVCLLDGSAARLHLAGGYSGLQDGPHAFSVRATDAAGNTGADTSHSWTIETLRSDGGVDVRPSGLSNSSAASFSFAADEPSAFDCKVDDRSFEPCSSPVTYHGLADGGHAFLVRASDAVGNLSAQVAHAWTIDTSGAPRRPSSRRRSPAGRRPRRPSRSRQAKAGASSAGSTARRSRSARRRSTTRVSAGRATSSRCGRSTRREHRSHTVAPRVADRGAVVRPAVCASHPEGRSEGHAAAAPRLAAGESRAVLQRAGLPGPPEGSHRVAHEARGSNSRPAGRTLGARSSCSPAATAGTSGPGTELRPRVGTGSCLVKAPSSSPAAQGAERSTSGPVRAGFPSPGSAVTLSTGTRPGPRQQRSGRGPGRVVPTLPGVVAYWS